MRNQTHRIYLFPFAGGASYSYNSLIAALEDHFMVIPLEMSGHGMRLGEELNDTMEAAVKDLMAQITTDLEPPYLFFGHSLGALSSYLCTLELEKLGYSLPEHLFLSGREGVVTNPANHLHHLPSEKLWDALIKLGGIASSIRDDKELRDFFEPLLRADLKMIEGFTMDPPVAIPVPITVVLGREDNGPEKSIIQWEEIATNPFQTYRLPGDHFYFMDKPHEILNIIQQSIAIGS